jgi:hypothetical protein
LSEYIIAAVRPRYAVKEGLDCKLPTDLPIPSACIRVVKTYQITTSSSGKIFVNYIPGSLLATNRTLVEWSTLTVNTTCDFAGTAGTNSFVPLDTADVP